MNGTMTSIAVKDRRIDAYLAVPRSGKGPGVMVLQEWWGLNENVKKICDRFAEAGYAALAPDLYHGQSASGPDEAGRLMMALNIEESARDLVAASEFLLSNHATQSKKIAVIGFCMGGQLALFSASLTENIGAVADFYGIHPNVQPDFSKVKAPILGIFAENDTFVNAEVVKKLEANLHAAGVKTDFETFKNVGHAFFNDSRPEVYNAEAAHKAWEKTLDHFKKYIQ